MIRRRVQLAVAATVMGMVAVSGMAVASAWEGGGVSSIRERLTGSQENPAVISTPGKGTFRASVDPKGEEITYRLSYRDLEGAVTQAHIHFGSKWQAAGISVWLCTNLGNGPVGTQACPAAPATITGVIKPVDVVGPSGQGITAGEFEELVKAVDAGLTYVNVHTDLFAPGEIRAQIEGSHHH